jgi:Resolvase, N terminal domain
LPSTQSSETRPVPRRCPPSLSHFGLQLVRNVLNLVHELEQRGAGLRVLEPEFSTLGNTGRIMLTMLGIVAGLRRSLGAVRHRSHVANSIATIRLELAAAIANTEPALHAANSELPEMEFMT